MRNTLYLVVLSVFYCFEDRFRVLFFQEVTLIVSLSSLNSLEEGIPCCEVYCLGILVILSDFSLFGRHFPA